MPLSECQSIPCTPSAHSIRGDEYEVANGQCVPNVGERKLEAKTLGSNRSKRIHFQVADIHKPLLSMAKVADMGFRSVFEKQGGYIEHIDTGEKIPMYRRDNLYFIKMWVRAAGSDDQNVSHCFGRQG